MNIYIYIYEKPIAVVVIVAVMRVTYARARQTKRGLLLLFLGDVDERSSNEEI